MKILAIHGSPHTTRSATRRLAGFILEGAAEAGADPANLPVPPVIE